ncbi:hypothetical protein PCANC_11206 [Puccinia coronata f. sp. avenae]|uniref:Uncharacterized protein n=1 Tax=Puccinia coronata f. sp. avenae TaxID=200324 RepID=A0A2N5V8N6_9BASI|nr:hypothetical protein PCANC_11206 [Puccinia coronata f. sp. avenae]
MRKCVPGLYQAIAAPEFDKKFGLLVFDLFLVIQCKSNTKANWCEGKGIHAIVICLIGFLVKVD